MQAPSSASAPFTILQSHALLPVPKGLLRMSFKPSDLSRLLSVGPEWATASDLRLRLDDILRQIDIQPHLAPEHPNIENDASAVRFAALLATDPNPIEIVDAWTACLTSKKATVAESLLIEYYISVGGACIAQALPRRLKYVKSILTIRQRVAIALHNYARQINWRRPVLFTAVLKLARTYLRDAKLFEDWTREDLRKEFNGRLGVATVLISRFEPVHLWEAWEAFESLEESLAQGNDPSSAVPYLLEAACVVHDHTADLAVLKRALDLEQDQRDSQSLHSPSWGLALVEASMRLASAGSSEGIAGAEQARAILSGLRGECQEAEEKVRFVLLREIVEAVLNGTLFAEKFEMRGIRLPFGIRDHREAVEPLLAIGDRLVGAIQPLLVYGEPLARGISADLLEAMPGADSDIPTLRRIIELRGGGRWPMLQDERSTLLCLRDELALARLENDKHARIHALGELVDLACVGGLVVAPLVVIADDLERNGACPTPLPPGLSAEVRHLWRHIGFGRHREILVDAASQAIENPDLSTISLGGRSQVTTVKDYYGLVGETLIFKRTTAGTWERELVRTALLTDALIADKLTGEYGLVENLGSTEQTETQPGAEIVTVRRFYRGRSFFELAEECDRTKRIDLLGRAARYLGWMNRTERSERREGSRKDLKAKEVGRWFRAISPEHALGSFNAWWRLVEHVELFARRDAHLWNWLLTPDGRILALDLETVGWRPFGYELAQITDDHALLHPSDWQARKEVFVQYVGALQYHGDLAAEWTAYEAAVLARSLRKLTLPGADAQTINHGRDALIHLAESGGNADLQRLARATLTIWRESQGHGDYGWTSHSLSEGRRVRISRAMAYHLRHDPELKTDRGGWAGLGSLADAMVSVSETELATVASDPHEKRYELENGRIRARYGHTRSIEMEYSPVTVPIRLFHAAPLEALERILEAGEGLRRMERQWVHMSSDGLSAVASGGRLGPPVLLTARSDSVNGVLFASGDTYLAAAVPSRALGVVPITCMPSGS